MLYKYIRSTIIVTIQLILPVALLLLLAPQLLQSYHGFNKAQQFFSIHKTGFLITHTLFYLALIRLWPIFIYAYITRSNLETTTEQMLSALKAKWYFIASLVFFELLVWWR